MGSIIRLVVLFGKLAITLIVVLLILYLSFLLVNRAFRLFAESMGYETRDLADWIKARLPKRKERHEERFSDRKTVPSRGLQEHQVHDDVEGHS